MPMGDGSLSAAEITSEDYVCNGPGLPSVVDGDVRVENSLEVALLAGVTTITGKLELWVGSSGPSSIVLPSLVDVGQQLHVIGSSLTTLDLPSLTTVGGFVEINMTSLSDLDGLSALVSVGNTVGGGINIGGNPLLTDITGLASVSSSAGQINYVTIQGNLLLASLVGLEGITGTLQNIYIGLNPALLSLASLSGVTDLSGNLTVEVNDSLTTLGLTSLSTVSNSFRVIDNPMLPECEATNLLAQLSAPPGGTIDTSGNDPMGVCP